MLIHLIGIHKLFKVYLLVWLGLQRRWCRVDDVSRLQGAGGGRGKRLNHSRQRYWRQMTGRLHWSRCRLAAQLLHLHPGAAHRGGQGGEEADRLLGAAGGHPVLVLQVGHLTLLLFLLLLLLFLLFHLLLSLLCQLTVVTFLSRAVAATRVVPVSS